MQKKKDEKNIRELEKAHYNIPSDERHKQLQHSRKQQSTLDLKTSFGK